jgi:DNA repair ATPase RecN/PHP family Zn ribbon phosphoesterase
MTPEEIKKQISLATARAANFKRVDLQIHSDESDDYPRPCDLGDAHFEPGPSDSKPLASSTILHAAQDKGLDLIAITDHMKSRKSCEVAAASPTAHGGTVALPGIEVNVLLTQVSHSTRDSVHILCIFKEGKSSEDIERIFHTARALKPYDARGSKDAIEIDLKTFVENVHKNDGICIASHVNSDKGLRRAFFSMAEVNYVLCKNEKSALEKQKNSPDWNQEKADALKVLEKREKQLADEIQNTYLVFLAEAGIDGVQIQKSAESQFYRGEHCESLSIRPLAAILTSDAHCTDAVGYEKKITYVKMTRASWSDLSLALKDPETRIRYADTVGTHRFTKIRGLVFVTADGFFKGVEKDGLITPQVLGFADNLTCLIGGRGAGKSATIDALRYIFKEKRQVDSLPESLRNDVYGRLDFALRDTAVHLLMEGEDGEEIIVKSFYAGWDQRSYESHYATGEDAGVDLSISSKYRAEIYGWNEIETLGTDSKKQLQLLDKFISDLMQVNDHIRAKRAELASNRSTVMERAKRLEGLIPNVREFDEAKSAYDKINTPEMQKVFSELDIILEKEKALVGLSEDLGAIGDGLKTDYDFSTKLQDLASRIKDEEMRARVFGKDNSQIERITSAYTNFRKEIEITVNALHVEIRAVSAAKNTALENLSQVAGGDIKGLANVEKRLARKTKYERLLSEKEKIKKERQQSEAALKERKNLLDQYIDLQKQRSKKRADTKDAINAKLNDAVKHGPRIAINFYPLGDKEEFQHRLGISTHEQAAQRETGLLKGVGLRYIERKFAEILSALVNPVAFVRRILDGVKEGFVGSHADGKTSIGPEDSTRIFNHLNPRLTDYDEQYFDSAKLAQLLELEEIELNDLPEITLEGQPISGLSPGQRCSALGPIILLQGNHPLVIDQPEDNLDNKLVFDLVVEILRNLKEFRQIIVATHNPNIPVSGDAEQILVFEPVSKTTGTIVHQGSIDDPKVIENVKNIMEGGAQAFLTRAEKYRYRISQ